MRRCALVVLLLLCACAGTDGSAPAPGVPASEAPAGGAGGAGTSGGGVDGSTGSGEILCPEPSPGSLPEPGCEPAPQPGQGAELVTPQPGMAGTHPVRWTGAEPLRDGAALRVTWISGVEPCSVLDRVELAETATEVRITLIEGSDPASPDTACIELGVTKVVEVPLAAPLAGRTLVDGAA